MKKIHLFVLAAMMLSGIIFSVVQIILADPSPIQTHPASEIECDTNLCVDAVTGTIGVGTISPVAKLQINAPASTEGLRIVTASNYSPLNIRNSANSADIFRVDQAGSLAVGSVPWARLSSFPSACTSGQYVTAIGSTLTCSTVSGLPSGTANQTLRNNGTTWVANSVIANDGTNIISSGNITLSGTNANIILGSNYLSGDGGDEGVSVNAAGTVLIGGGTGKLTVGTVDPVYNIQGTKYATYMSGMLGVKEETTGIVQLANGEYTIDFKELDQGSDLYIFYRITDFGQNWSKLSILLAAEGPGGAWYKKEPQNNRLIVYSQNASSVSFRLTAPRFDWQKWLNRSDDGTAEGLQVDEIVNDSYIQNQDGSSSETNQTEGGFAQIIKETVASLGLVVENGIATIKQLVAERITADTAEVKQFQTKDKATGQTYCIWIEQGDWVKIQGTCAETANSGVFEK